jgi:hypothetical protein
MKSWFEEQKASWNQRFSPTFSEIFTMQGLGFSFNLLDSSEVLNLNEYKVNFIRFYTSMNFSVFRISEDFVYTRNVEVREPKLLKMPPSTIYPLKISSKQPNEFSLRFSRLQLPDQYERCFAPSIIVHSNDFLPSFYESRRFKQFDYGMTLDVEISSEIVKTEESLRKISPDERECYFEGEKLLRFFKTYSFENCEEECFTNFTFPECNCSDYNHLRGKDMEICTGEDSQRTCDQQVKAKLLTMENFSTRQNCSCFPLCNSIKYNVKYFPIYHNEGNETILNFRLNTEDTVVYKRYQQFTAFDVVSYVGGLLGLFAGISFLSIFEFFYFITLRLIVNVWRLIK